MKTTDSTDTDDRAVNQGATPMLTFKFVKGMACPYMKCAICAKPIDLVKDLETGDRAGSAGRD